MDYEIKNKKSGGPIGYHVSDDYIDDGTMCRSPSHTPGVIGTDSALKNPYGKSPTEIHSVTNTALDVLRNITQEIEESIEDNVDDVVNRLIGAGKGAAWAAEEIVEELAGSVKSLYTYLASGQVTTDTLLALLKLANRYQRSMAIITGPDPIGESYESLKQDFAAIMEVREQLLKSAGKAGLQFLKEYGEAEKQGKEQQVVGKWLGYISVQAVAALSPTGRVSNVRHVAQAAEGSVAKKTASKSTAKTSAASSKRKKTESFEPAVTPSQMKPVSNSKTSGATSNTATSSSKQTQPKPAQNASQSTQEGGKLDNGKDSPANDQVCTRGCPISMVNGEELLEQTDFELPGPIPLVWNRTYRTSHNQDYGLGAGWSAPYFARLLIKDKEIIYADGEGRKIPFTHPAEGDGCHNTVERLTLYRDDNSQLRIVSEDETTLLFKGGGKTKRLHAIRNGNGHSINFQYSESGRLSHVIDSAGRQLKLDYNITNRLRSVNILDDKDKPLGKPLVQYRYSNQGDLISVVDAAGNAQHFEYQNHVITKRTTKDGFNYFFEWDQYDIHGKCVHNWGDRNIYDYRFEYDEANKITKSTDGRGNTTIFHYNHLGLITKEVDPEGGVKEFEYDSNGRLLLERDPMGNTTRYSYNAIGKLTRVVNPLGHTTRLTYDSAGRLNSLIDAMGMRWRRNYDAKGRLTSASDPQGQAVQYRYDEQGNPVAITDAMKRNQRLEWNAIGQLISKTDAAGNRQEYHYDHLGRITEVHEHGNQVTKYFYDPMGRVTQVFHPNGASVQLSYTPEGRLARYVDALGRTTQYRYDGLSQPIERINPHGQTFKYEYDAERNLTALINENGERYELHYDKNERLIKEVGFDGRVQHYGYDAAGHLVSHTDGVNRITQFKRDAIGQLLKKWSSDQDISRYEYDPLGRLVHAINKDSELEFKYSDNGRLIEERQNGVRLRHEYDLIGQRSATSLNNELIEYDYNAQGLFKRIAYNGLTLTSVTRNAQGQEIARTSGAISSFFEYDPMGRLIRQRAAKDQSPILERNYKYDKSGNLRQIDDVKFGKTLFKYDALDRLQAVEGLTPERFSFDPAGNLLDAREAFAGGYVKGNRLKVFQDYRFEYDDVGNLIREQKGKKETRYYYNTQNQLVKVEKGGQTFQYAYDPLGRRIKKHDAFGQTNYVWDGNTLLSELRQNIKITYIHEPGSYQPLCQIRDGSVYYYHNDHLGTPQTVTDVNGEVVWEARYKVYGNVITYETEAIDNNIRFQGQYYDPETGLHYNRNRYYHPVIGRFIHQDPIGLLGGNNNYEYAPNPVTWVDPLGLSAKKGDCNGLVGASGKLYNKQKSMDPEYIGEHLPNNPQWSIIGGQVKYLSNTERSKYELFVKDGKLYDAQGNIFDTYNSRHGNAIFVMDQQGRIYASTEQSIGEFHHSSFLAGQPVAAAGEIEVINGTLTMYSRNSGHYKPDKEHLDQFVEELNERGLDTTYSTEIPVD